MARFEHTCGFCAGVFYTDDWRQNYCSEGCRLDAKRLQHRQWRAEQLAARRRKNLPPPLTVEQVLEHASRRSRETGTPMSYGKAVVELGRRAG